MQLKLQQAREGAGKSPAPKNWTHSAKGAHRYRKACRCRGIKVAVPPLDSPCDRPVTYPGDTKTLIKSSKGRSRPTMNMTTQTKRKKEHRMTKEEVEAGNNILRIKEQKTHLTLHENDDNDAKFKNLISD
jgi:hypothetical protein